MNRLVHKVNWGWTTVECGVPEKLELWIHVWNMLNPQPNSSTDLLERYVLDSSSSLERNYMYTKYTLAILVNGYPKYLWPRDLQQYSASHAKGPRLNGDLTSPKYLWPRDLQQYSGSHAKGPRLNGDLTSPKYLWPRDLQQYSASHAKGPRLNVLLPQGFHTLPTFWNSSKHNINVCSSMHKLYSFHLFVDCASSCVVTVFICTAVFIFDLSSVGVHHHHVEPRIVWILITWWQHVTGYNPFSRVMFTGKGGRPIMGQWLGYQNIYIVANGWD